MSVRRSLAWAFSGQFITFAVQFAGSIIIARLLSPRELGTYAIAMAALGLMQVFTTFGISSFIVRETELAPGTLESAFTVNAILAVSLSILVFSVSFVAGPMLGETNAGPVLRVVAFANLFGILSFRPAAMLQRDMQFRQLSIIALTNGLMATFSTVAFALAGASYMSPAYGALIAAITGAVLTMTLGSRHVGFRLGLNGWRPITTFGLQMMSVSGVATITGKLSDLVLGRILGVAALGIYSRASNISGMLFDNLYGTATRVIFVQLSKDYREGGEWSTTYLRGFAMLSAVMWPVLAGLAVLAQPAILILYGDKWLPAAGPLSALMVAQIIGVGFGMNWELFVLRGETGRQARYETMRLIFGVPIFVIGCLFGLVTAALAKIVDALIGLVVYYPHVRRLAEIGPREVPTIYRDSAALTLVAVSPSLALMMWHNWSAHTPILEITATVTVGVVLWLALLFYIRHPLRDEIVMLFRKLPGTGVSP